MENKIKVTVEYENPEMSKFDALIEQYAIATKIANEKTTAIKGVIEEVGRAKFEAIGEQLKEVGAKLRQFCLAGKRVPDSYLKVRYQEGTWFEIRYDYDKDDLEYSFNVGTWSSGYNFFYQGAYKYLIQSDGLVTHWNEYDLINRLNKELESKITSYIKEQFSHINDKEKHLATMLQ